MPIENKVFWDVSETLLEIRRNERYGELSSIWWVQTHEKSANQTVRDNNCMLITKLFTTQVLSITTGIEWITRLANQTYTIIITPYTELSNVKLPNGQYLHKFFLCNIYLSKKINHYMQSQAEVLCKTKCICEVIFASHCKTGCDRLALLQNVHHKDMMQ